MVEAIQSNLNPPDLLYCSTDSALTFLPHMRNNSYCGLATRPVNEPEQSAVNDKAIRILGKFPEVGQRLERQTARDVIAGKLKSLIAMNMLVPGDTLPGERELANVLNVSRETIRSAIQILAAEGFIEVSQGSRSKILAVDLTNIPVTITASRPIDHYDLDSVHAARLLIEVHVVGQAAERVDDAALAQLEALLEAQQQIKGDVSRFLISDREFHACIYRACGNPLLADMVTDLYTYMIEFRRMAMAEPNAIEASYADHLQIFVSLKAHDRGAVVAAFSDHLGRIYKSTRQMQQQVAAAGTG